MNCSLPNTPAIHYQDILGTEEKYTTKEKYKRDTNLSIVCQ